MKKILLLIFGIFVLCFNRADAAHVYPEKYYQKEWCDKWGGVMEYKLPDKTRVDCVTKTYAAEFDFAPKWAEAIGQSLYYSKMTGKKPAIILIIEKEQDFEYFKRAKALALENDITLWYMKKPAFVSASAKNKNTARNTHNGVKFNIDGNEFFISFSDIEKILANILKLAEGLI